MKGKVQEARKPKKQKVAKVDEIKDKLNTSKVIILTEHSGLTVSQITNLRKKLRKANAEFRVFKNTLTNIALEGKDAKDLSTMLAGPNAFLMGYDDPVTPVKILSDFIKENEKPVIKGGLIDSEFLNIDEIKKLAKLPPKEVLLAKVVGGIQAPIYGLVNVLQGSIRNLVYALAAVRDQKSK